MIWAIGLSELRVVRRLLRTWFVIALALLMTGYYFWEQWSLYASASFFSASVSAINPKYSLGGASSALLLILQIGVVLLVFDSGTRDIRARIAEAFAARPFTNFELLSGKLLGTTFLMSISAAVLVVLLALTGFVLHAFHAALGEPLEPWSVLSLLLLDLVPNIALWSAVTIVAALLVRSVLLAAAFSMALAVALFVFNILVPAYLLPAVANATSLVIAPSDLAAEFANGWVVSQRLVMIFATLGLLFLGALLYPRRDAGSRSVRTAAGFGCLFVAAGIQTVLILNAIAARDDFERIASLHESISMQPRVDIEHIKGTVVIDPGDHLRVEYELTFLSPSDIDTGLVFAFNPGFNIESLTLNGESLPYEFSDGLIRIPIDSINDNESYELALFARGDPDTSFGYLDAPLNKYKGDGLQARSLAMLGVHKAVFHEQYVALTPAIKWYPTAGSAYGESDIGRVPRDQFTVDLRVSVPHGWIVAGPGAREDLPDTDRTRFRFAPRASLPEVGLFSAEFVRRSTTIADVEFELLMSPKHTHNIELFARAMPIVRERVEEMFSRARELDIQYPYDSLSLVEVPSVLRIYGGGWRTDTIHALPGVFLIRESGFPTAGFDAQVVTSLSEDNDERTNAEILVALLENYYENDLSGGNPYTTVTRNLMHFQTSPTGSGAIPLSYMVDSLVSRIVHSKDGFFSIYYAGNRSKVLYVSQVARFPAEYWASLGPLAKEQRNATVNRPHVWDQLSTTSLTDLPFRMQPRDALEALILKTEILAEMLLDTNDPENVAQLLAEVRRRFQGSTYTFEEFQQTAQDLNIDMDTLFAVSLNEGKLPGFRAYEPNAVRLPDDDMGTSVYQTTFYLANEEPVDGFVHFSHQVWTGDSMSSPIKSPLVKISADSVVQIALHTENSLISVQIRTYLSLNQQDIQVDVPSLNSWEPQEHQKLPFATVTDWRPAQDASIIVDDLDDGFKVRGDIGSSGVRVRVQNWWSLRYYWQSLNYYDPFDRLVYDGGLPTSQSIGLVDDAQFSRYTTRFAWGRYRPTTAFAPSDALDKTAHFSARLPHAGTWKLEYHYPLPRMVLAEVLGSLSTSDSDSESEQVNLAELIQPGKSFLVTVSTSKSSIPGEIQDSNLQLGWNHVGAYDLESGDVEVTLQPNGSILVYADAIRWTPSK